MAFRACDPCRARKVKCDGLQSGIPCANCRMSSIACQYRDSPKKRGPRKRLARSREPVPSLAAVTSSPLPSPTTLEVPTTTAYMAPLLPTVNPTADLDLDSPASFPLGANSPVGLVVPSPGTVTSTPPVFCALLLGAREADLEQQVLRVHNTLMEELARIEPRFPLQVIVSRCIDVYMHVLFGTLPLVHEPTLRAYASLQKPSLRDDVSQLRLYTLITALCAATARLLSGPSDPNGSLLGPVFLHASRQMLQIYHDYDTSHPNSSSLVARQFQAAALHTEGKRYASGILFGEAFRIAELMHLHDERSYENLDDPVEAKLRRNAFWMLLAHARFANIVEGYSFLAHAGYLDSTITARLSDDARIPLMDATVDATASTLEEQLFVGYSLYQSLWQKASDILLDLHCMLRFQDKTDDCPLPITETQRNRLACTYVDFLGALDSLPAFLHNPSSVEADSESQTAIQRRLFWVQRTNLFVTYHSLRIILLKHFWRLGLADVIGMSSDKAMLFLRITEIAHDLVTFVAGSPFEALHANGETCVAKIRQVGVSLLEVIHQAEALPILLRGKSLFPSILDVLAKLDSRASDQLESEYPQLLESTGPVS